jgi:hypothetical protein
MFQLNKFIQSDRDLCRLHRLVLLTKSIAQAFMNVKFLGMLYQLNTYCATEK